MYGYAGLLPGMNAVDIGRVRRKLGSFARREGFALVEVFVLERPGYRRFEVWRELLASCRVFGVCDIAVPSLAHLHPSETIARFMRDDVARHIGGCVWIADERHGTPAVVEARRGVMAR
jgi:hypothetical protein